MAGVCELRNLDKEFVASPEELGAQFLVLGELEEVAVEHDLIASLSCEQSASCRGRQN